MVITKQDVEHLMHKYERVSCLRGTWKRICSRRNIYKFTLFGGIIFVAIQILQLFVNIHYNAIPYYVQRSIISDRTLDTLAEVNIPIKTEIQHHVYSWKQCQCVENRSSLFLGNHSLAERITLNDFREDQSTCSNEATYFGKGQKVISFSLFVSDPEAVPYFFHGVIPNLKKLKDIYPGWFVCIYTNVPINKHSCSLICKFENLFWCNVKHIPELGDLSSVNGRVWRFLPLGDPTVDIFVSRDLDSLPTVRERIAVSEWENSNKTFHIMRDSQWHGTEILAGLWGAQNILLDPTVAKRIQSDIIKDGKRSQTKSLDQQILRERVYYPYSSDILAHDSYFCNKFMGTETRPFSTKRNGEEFVGHDFLKEENTLFVGRLKPCPVKCRQREDWKYC